MARNPYAKRGFRPKRANGAIGLKFNNVYRCNTCGSLHKEKIAQCLCGSIAFTYFDSEVEANRWGTLLFYESTGHISDLRRQVHITLHTKGPDGLTIKVGKYIADFDYNNDKGIRVIEDVKGLITDLASWKLRHVKAEYGVDVLITKGT